MNKALLFMNRLNCEAIYLLEKKPFTILSIDGGGVRGLAALRILQEIEKQTGKRPNEIFDMICGTSTGGIIAILHGLLGKSIHQCMKIYRNICKKLFVASGNANRFLPEILLRLYHLQKESAQYDHENFEKIIKDIIDDCDFNKDIKICEILQSSKSPKTPYVFVVSTKMHDNNGDLFLFRNYNNSAQSNDGSDGVKIWEAVRATASPPSYFCPIEIKDLWCFEDGGIVANNPSKIALEEYEDIKNSLHQDKKPIFLLSLSTGKQTPQTGVNRYIQGLTNSENVHQLLNNVSTKNPNLFYYRLNPDDLGNIKLDDSTRADDIIKTTEKYIRKGSEAHTLLAQAVNMIKDILK